MRKNTDGKMVWTGNYEIVMKRELVNCIFTISDLIRKNKRAIDISLLFTGDMIESYGEMIMEGFPDFWAWATGIEDDEGEEQSDNIIGVDLEEFLDKFEEMPNSTITAIESALGIKLSSLKEQISEITPDEKEQIENAISGIQGLDVFMKENLNVLGVNKIDEEEEITEQEDEVVEEEDIIDVNSILDIEGLDLDKEEESEISIEEEQEESVEEEVEEEGNEEEEEEETEEETEEEEAEETEDETKD
tara:strand:+ start:1226 stop:1966 length:741 start_codon:yes stop_codon:yes gene_type:complete